MTYIKFSEDEYEENPVERKKQDKRKNKERQQDRERKRG